jgi:hypothetical protein
LPVENLQDFFRASIDEAISRQGVPIDPHATHYVVNLLTLFSRSDQLYEYRDEVYGLRPLALMLADASAAETQEERSAVLRRIGDVSLFISGFFADSLATHAVDIDYYISMGGSAYGSLSEEVRGTFHGNAFGGIYRELASKFQPLVDVLNDVRDGAAGGNDADLLRLYEVWLKTGSKRARKLLMAQDVIPIDVANGLRKH